MIDSSGNEYFYLQDTIFNVTAVVESDGDVTERDDYTPYAEVTYLSSSFIVQNLSLIFNEYLYTGRRLDPETGLQLNRYRFYASHLGRWLKRDPVGYVGGTNMYGYVGGMPTYYVDPHGLKEMPWPAPYPTEKQPMFPIIRGPQPNPPPPNRRRPRDHRDGSGKCKIKRIKLMCRKMPMMGNRGMRHCYLAIENEAGDVTETISGVQEGGGGGAAGPNRICLAPSGWDQGHCNDPNDGTDDREYPFSIPCDPCKFYDCAMDAAADIHGSFDYGGAFGFQGQNNSNTFLTEVIKRCKGTADFPWSAWGSDDIPPSDPPTAPPGYTPPTVFGPYPKGTPGGVPGA